VTCEGEPQTESAAADGDRQLEELSEAFKLKEMEEEWGGEWDESFSGSEREPPARGLALAGVTRAMPIF
jgi:hypothetical protein